MAYIGIQPAEKFTSFATQEFSTSATTSYTLDHAVANENEIALFVNNVRQQPGSGKAYTASSTTLTLSAATASTDTMYCVFLGRALQTVTPATNSITRDMVVAPVSSNGLNSPAWSAEATGLTVANATWTELVLGTENFDTNSAYNASNGRFTVPAGEGGIYTFFYSFGLSGNPDDGEKVSVRLYKNGSAVSLSVSTGYVSAANQTTAQRGSYMLNLSAADYVSVYGYHNEGSSNSDGTGTFLGFKLS